MKPITGSIVALATPLHPDGSVDYPTLRKLVDWHVAEGTDCIGVVGTTGESPTVNVQEHCEIIRVSVEQAAKRVPIMAGCGANSTAEAIELAKFAKQVGADCQLQVVPYYNRPTQEGQYQHFKAIAEATPDLPCILYNNPPAYKTDVLPVHIAELASEHANLVRLLHSEDAKKLDSPNFPATAMLAVADHWLAGKLAEARGDSSAMIEHLEKAVQAEADLPYMEPAYWPLPARPTLGAALIRAGKPAQAEAVFREDVQRWPRNGWGLFGLEQSLRAQGKFASADIVHREFDKAWKRADVKLDLAWF